jgi:hypothetical protein
VIDKNEKWKIKVRNEKIKWNIEVRRKRQKKKLKKKGIEIRDKSEN